MTPSMILDYMGILIDSNAAQDTSMKVNLVLVGGQDAGNYLLTLNAGVLLYQQGVLDPDADATLTLSKIGLFALLTNNQKGIAQIKVEGDASVIKKLMEHLTPTDFFFNIVEP
jgi:alkyl sulfatase BDS1-like metallo-beta-lactamase superfamily hydrolase